MNIDPFNRLNRFKNLLRSKKENERTRLIVAGSPDQLSHWKDWREGKVDFALLGSWPNERLTIPDERE